MKRPSLPFPGRSESAPGRPGPLNPTPPPGATVEELDQALAELETGRERLESASTRFDVATRSLEDLGGALNLQLEQVIRISDQLATGLALLQAAKLSHVAGDVQGESPVGKLSAAPEPPGPSLDAPADGLEEPASPPGLFLNDDSASSPTSDLTRDKAEEEDYLHIIAHDLKEPLRGISYFSEVLTQDYASRLDDEGRGHLEYLSSAAARMNQLLDDVLLLSRLRRTPISLQRVSLRPQIERSIQELEKLCQERSAQIRLEGMFGDVRADAERLREALRQLIENALVYSPPPAAVVIRGERVGKQQAVVVSDKGTGIPLEFQPHIFDLFYRLHTWEQVPGSGAGLTIARLIARQHRGELRVSSSPGQGASFRLILPVE